MEKEKEQSSCQKLVEKEISSATEAPSHVKEESRDPNRERWAYRKEQLISIYDSLDQFLKSKDFEEDFKKVLETSDPNYMIVLEKRMRDIKTSDQGIVIAGETSAGKSSLINKILGKRIFIGKNQESTSTVCKIRNSERIRIIIKRESGEMEERDLTDSCDVNTSEGVKYLRKNLDELTNMESSEESKKNEYVDIGFPIPFLKGDIILVDTPGIGGSGEVSHKLTKYLPKALSFIFVINVTSAGGMQRDRLPQILHSLSTLHEDGDMPSFEPRDVIFITNKWDAISKNVCDSEEGSDSEEEDETESLWKKLLGEISDKWPSVNVKNIFKMSLKEVSPKKSNPSVEQFREFQKVLMLNIEKAESSRVKNHLRILRELLRKINLGLHARLRLNKKNEEDQKAKAELHRKEIEKLKKKCEEMKVKLQQKVTEHIENTAEEMYRYMKTTSGKQNILYPKEGKPIEDIFEETKECAQEVQCRYNRYLHLSIKSKKVTKGFEEIQEETVSFYNEISLRVYQMENKWADNSNDDKERPQEHQQQAKELSAFEVGAAIILSPIWVPMAAVAAISIGLVVIPVSSLWNWITDKQGQKRKAMDDEYDKCVSSVRDTVRRELKNSSGDIVERDIIKVTVDALPNRLEALEELIQQLIEKREEILAKRDLLLNLSSKIKAMELNICSLQEDLKQNEMLAKEEKF